MRLMKAKELSPVRMMEFILSMLLHLFIMATMDKFIFMLMVLIRFITILILWVLIVLITPVHMVFLN